MINLHESLSSANRSRNSAMHRKGAVFIALLWVFQSIGRLFFSVAGMPSGMGQFLKFLNNQVTYETSVFLFVMFSTLGVFGLVAAFGLLSNQSWGFWAIIITSASTIGFDIWGYTLQSSAAFGFIVPIISLLYIGLSGIDRKDSNTRTAQPSSSLIKFN